MQNSGPLARVRPFVPILLDIVVPTALYFAFKRLGMSDFWALTLAGVSTGITTLINTIRRRRMDFVGVLVMLEIALAVALLFATNDPRVVAIKPSFFTAFSGVFLWVTCFVGRPVVYQAAAPMATKGDPAREIAYDRAWLESREFRFRERLMTAAFGAMLVAEAALRVFVVYHYSVNDLEKSFVLSQLPGIVLLLAVLGFFRLNVPAISRIVDAIQAEVTMGQQSERGHAGKGR
ncbi:VC0807 family protein [Streptomyces sp. NPDC056411]|uniref:VC0807 family protein n=1 Tax=Streptomyces sp. NPDC056411 TaxID=3345813 RepID=UPI0035E28FF0